MPRSLLVGYLLEALGVLGLSAVVGVEFGWPWALLPVSLYLLVLGVLIGGRS